jgi:hypothetical protein
LVDRLFIGCTVFLFPSVDAAVPACVSCLCPSPLSAAITFVDAVLSEWK